MQKIPSVFKRDYEGTRAIYPELVEGCEWVLAGEGVPTVKIDGTACLVKDNQLYKRYDAKAGKPHPAGFIPAQDEPDTVTGHFPGWVPVGAGPEDRWHREAWAACKEVPANGTYELIGAKVQGNPYQLVGHSLVRHGESIITDLPTWDTASPDAFFNSLKHWFADHKVEGIVWHHPDGRIAKIKRRDFGFPWNVS